ncbi:potassium channel subfamily T member 2-like isoform X2 [Amphibalanus amphitrite]|uniref:potassium channel subfamily T member 2-like isoform X2 n=1 Tax=Amphibalanus amphitrite TaxID=1232801 RepID=UPI001C9010C5|nr:potassium channel subfamily T member 2-like isoform X2 [Amphibalanus amphitrite]
MSNVFFFRLRSLRREQERRKTSRSNVLTVAPSRLFERTPMEPADSLDKVAEAIPRVRVEYYVNENTLKERLHLYFIKNQRSSLRIRIFNLVIKLLTCVLYIVRVAVDQDPINATCFGCPAPDRAVFEKNSNLTKEQFMEVPSHEAINWAAIWFVDRRLELWITQTVLALVSLSEALLLAYLTYKGNLWQQLLNFYFILELVNTIPFMATVFWSPLRNIFVPVFLNCWLAKYALENMFNDLNRAMQRSQSALSQQLMVLSATLLCLVFTSVCGIQHFQRAGHRHLNIFQASYFVIVTFSTVGYGDFVPDIWPSQLFMVIMICVALIVLPTQFEQLAYTWMERKKLGGTYSSHRAANEKHVVVCSTTLHADTIMDFLNEFYAHPLLQDYYVVLLSPMELDATMRMILQVPIWAQRVIYIQGSCLKDGDLNRARMNDAEACFILAARSYADKTAADDHTIVRSWAVKDFAPNVPQYVQIFRPENKVHVKFAEHVVCEDEFKYALLANNCLCPGTSTLVTLLLHTSRGQEGQTSEEDWHRLYGRCSGNEIYHIRLGDSRFFGEYEGKSFTYASFHTHRKYGVALVGVRPSELPEFYEDTILLNPGPRHIMKNSDICFYMSITKEENSAFVAGDAFPEVPITMPEKQNITDEKSKLNQRPTHTTVDMVALEKQKLRERPLRELQRGMSCESRGSVPSMSSNHLDVPRVEAGDPPGATLRIGARRPSILPVPDQFTSSTLNVSGSRDSSDERSESEDEIDSVPWRPPSEKIAIVKGFPPVTPYIGVSPTLCYLLREKKPLCCLQLAQVCEHCSYRSAKEYSWQNKAVILAADFASNGIYNFIIPLRAHFRPKSSLNPIILLLERRPDLPFLDAISYFPLVYWMLGSIDSLDDLCRAGINLAENVVVVNKEQNNAIEEDSLSDSNTIVAVQTMFKFFPSIKIITELSQSSNMRFMQFRAQDSYALHLSKIEKREKDRGSHISCMFRLPFAAGSVFSASMLDTLLYQAFVKDYLIIFVRLLLGIDQAPGSGFLTSMRILPGDMWIRTYGRLYQKLCSTTCEIPIGIYRTMDTSESASDLCGQQEDPKANHSQLIERAEIAQLVRSRMQSLGLPVEDYDDVSEKRGSISYVIINPSCDLKLEEGDIVYLIRPSPFSAQKTFERHNSRRKSNISMCDPRRRGSACSRNTVAKSNSLSLPDSPHQNPPHQRARSSSLRVDDILMKRSNSLRLSLYENTRNISSLEELGGLGDTLPPLNPSLRERTVHMPATDSIGLKVTPPEEHQVAVTLGSGSESSIPSIHLEGTIV